MIATRHARYSGVALGLLLALASGAGVAQNAGPCGRGERGGAGMGPGMDQGMGQGMDQGMEPGGGPGIGSRRMFGGRDSLSMGMGGGRWWDDPAVAQQLFLTADQRKKMDEILSTHRLALIDQVAAVQRAETVLDPLVAADAPNESAILAQIGKVAEARAELEKSHARMLLALRAELTRDQWFKLKAMHPARREGRNWGERPPGDAGAPPQP